MSKNIFQCFSIYVDKMFQVIFRHVLFFSGGFQDIPLPIYPVPLSGILCKIYPYRMFKKGLDSAPIDLNGVPHEVSSGVCQGNLISSIFVCFVAHYILEESRKLYRLKVRTWVVWHNSNLVRPVHINVRHLPKHICQQCFLILCCLVPGWTNSNFLHTVLKLFLSNLPVAPPYLDHKFKRL